MKTIYVMITRNKDGGYRFALHTALHELRPRMQSAKEDREIAARHNAERLFGQLNWRNPDYFGCELSFVVAIAELKVAP